MKESPRSRRPTSGSPWTFFGLVFGLSVPFWVAGGLVPVSDDVPLQLPASALMFVCPAIAATVLLRRERGRGPARQLLRSTVSVASVEQERWYLPALLLMPLVMLASYGLMSLAGTPFPPPDASLYLVPVQFVVFFLAAAAEEAGWTGYATRGLQTHRSALTTALIVGTVWACWHVLPYVQGGHSAGWIVWQCVATVALRVLIVWLHNNADHSVFIAAVFHAMINVSNAGFPTNGSQYDPAVTGPLLVLLAVIVALGWGRSTLAEPRYRLRSRPPAARSGRDGDAPSTQ